MLEQYDNAPRRREWNATMTRNAVIGLLILGGIALAIKTGIESDPEAVAIANDASRNGSLATPGIDTFESVRQADGSQVMTIDGLHLICGDYNNPDNPWGTYPRDTWNSALPTYRTGIDILQAIGEPGIDPAPYYIVIDGQIVDVRHDLHGWPADANGKGVCVEVRQQ